jgi:tetratricopeptide (TPR) repeat protein
VELVERLLLGEDSRALALAEVFREAYPDQPAAHWSRGWALAQAGFHALAGAALRHVFAQWPDYQDLDLVRAQLRVVDSALRELHSGEEPKLLCWRAAISEALEGDRWEAARGLLEQGLLRWPADRPGRNSLSLVQAYEGQFEEAILTAESVSATSRATSRLWPARFAS